MDWDPLFVVIIDICLLPISSAHTAEKSKTFSEGEIATVIGFSAKVIKEVQIGGNVCRVCQCAMCHPPGHGRLVKHQMKGSENLPALHLQGFFGPTPSLKSMINNSMD